MNRAVARWYLKRFEPVAEGCKAPHRDQPVYCRKLWRYSAVCVRLRFGEPLDGVAA